MSPDCLGAAGEAEKLDPEVTSTKQAVLYDFMASPKLFYVKLCLQFPCSILENETAVF